jgi:hypothetical protein
MDIEDEEENASAGSFKAKVISYFAFWISHIWTILCQLFFCLLWFSFAKCILKLVLLLKIKPSRMSRILGHHGAFEVWVPRWNLSMYLLAGSHLYINHLSTLPRSPLLMNDCSLPRLILVLQLAWIHKVHDRVSEIFKCLRFSFTLCSRTWICEMGLTLGRSGSYLLLQIR